MFAVCVSFDIAPDCVSDFLTLMRRQAENSLQMEPGCHVFDICTAPDSSSVFLYELYADAEAFQQHLNSSHFLTFDAAVQPMVRAKTVSTYPTVIRS